MWKTEYDSVGNVIKKVDPLNRATRFEYDALRHLVATVFPDGSSVKQQFNSASQLASVTDPNGQTTQYEYDSRGNLIVVVDSLNGRTKYSYDEMSNLISKTDANGNTTRFEYDQLGRRVATVLPLGQRSTRKYDSAGNLVGTKDYNGDETSFEYDARNRLVLQRNADNSTVRYTYTSTGARETVLDTRGTTRYAYNALDQVVSRTEPDGSRVDFAYDIAGNVKSITTRSGTTNYEYDANGHISAVIGPDQKTTRYSYDAMGNQVRVELPTGVTEELSFDQNSRVSHSKYLGPNGLIVSSSYQRDSLGRIIEILENTGKRTSYLFDAIGRLTKETIAENTGVRTITYTYDAVGNRLSRNDSIDGLTTSTYDANDRLVSDSISGNVDSYIYDNNGNLLSRIRNAGDQSHYEWDSLGRLTRFDTTIGSSNHVAVYHYNSDGMRVAVVEDGKETRYLIDNGQAVARVLEEYSSNAQVIASYQYGNQLISQTREGTSSYYVWSGTGNVQALVGANGTVTDTYHYDSFGRILSQNGTTQNDYLFRGEARDAISGLYYLRARYLDVSHGGFLGRDPQFGSTTEPMTYHPYLYAQADPVNNFDPTGRFTLTQTLAVLKVSAAVSAAATASLASGYVIGANVTRLKEAPIVFDMVLATMNRANSFLYPIDNVKSGLQAPGTAPTRPHQHIIASYLWHGRRFGIEGRKDLSDQQSNELNTTEALRARDVEYYFVGRYYAHFGPGADGSDRFGHDDGFSYLVRLAGLFAGVFSVYEGLKILPQLTGFLTQSSEDHALATPSQPGGFYWAAKGIIDSGKDIIDGGPYTVRFPRPPDGPFH